MIFAILVCLFMITDNRLRPSQAMTIPKQGTPKQSCCEECLKFFKSASPNSGDLAKGTRHIADDLETLHLTEECTGPPTPTDAAERSPDPDRVQHTHLSTSPRLRNKKDALDNPNVPSYNTFGA
jgi:hypothetical protein